MKKFLLGLVLGIFVSAVLCFFLYPDLRSRVQMGRMLDRDTIYLKDGSVLHGWIVEENETQIFVEVGKGYFTLPRSQCHNIRRNTFLRYVRELV